MFVIRETTHYFYLVEINQKAKMVTYKPDKNQAIKFDLIGARKTVDILNQKFGDIHIIDTE